MLPRQDGGERDARTAPAASGRVWQAMHCASPVRGDTASQEREDCSAALAIPGAGPTCIYVHRTPYTGTK